MDVLKWRPEILNETEYLVFHSYNVFFMLTFFFFFFVQSIFNISLFTSVVCFFKMDNGENIENARYAMNDDTAGFINQMENITQVGNLCMI